MDDRDAWLEDVKRWYFDERRVEGEQGMPIVLPAPWQPVQARRQDGPTTPTRQRKRSDERPDAH